jgi:non-ribosomal peptide synthetase component F
MEWILAVLKSGAAYAIVDQSHPVERSRAAISVAEPSMIVDDGGSPKSKELFEGFEGKVISTNDINLSGMPSHNLTDESEDDDLAYIVFTSGSTGELSPA